MVTLTDEQRIEYDKRNRRLLAAVRAGVPYPLIAERFSLTRPRVSQIATSAGIYRRKPRKAPPCDTKNP
jgi:hypothetical protein